uniref:Uncharacterized protein n=1 Tax=Plectus sambesii TaxID=2011161 RepID=A0A914XI18_9BILA
MDPTLFPPLTPFLYGNLRGIPDLQTHLNCSSPMMFARQQWQSPNIHGRIMPILKWTALASKEERRQNQKDDCTLQKGISSIEGEDGRKGGVIGAGGGRGMAKKQRSKRVTKTGMTGCCGPPAASGVGCERVDRIMGAVPETQLPGSVARLPLMARPAVSRSTSTDTARGGAATRRRGRRAANRGR